MSGAQRSIKQQLGRAKSLQAKRATVQNWAADWQAEHLGLLATLERAAREGDGHRAAVTLAGLRTASDKRFAALPGVLDALLAYEDDHEPQG